MEHRQSILYPGVLKGTLIILNPIFLCFFFHLNHQISRALKIPNLIKTNTVLSQ